MKSVRKGLYRFAAAAQRIITPGLRNSQYLYRELLLSRMTSDTRWLDLGCGRQVVPDWMPDAAQAQQAILECCGFAAGIDGDLWSLQHNQLLCRRIQGNIERSPFNDNSFNLITANMVIEHVRDPKALLAEVKRVLAPGGIFMIHTPNARSYATVVANLLPERLRIKVVYLLQGRRAEDVFPTFYRMNAPKSVRELAAAGGFELKELRLVESSAQTVMLGPMVIAELAWIATLRSERLQSFRTNIIALLEKPNTQ